MFVQLSMKRHRLIPNFLNIWFFVLEHSTIGDSVYVARPDQNDYRQGLISTISPNWASFGSPVYILTKTSEYGYPLKTNSSVGQY